MSGQASRPSGQDPFEIVADQIVLIRGEIRELKRTSLDREDAAILNAEVAEALDRMTAAAASAPQALRDALEADRAQTRAEAVRSAIAAAQGAVEGVRGDLEAERQRYADGLSEARRAARRSVRGSWAWFATAALSGALLCALVIYGTETAKAAVGIPRLALLACEAIGGQKGESQGQGYCVFWDG